MALLDNLTGGLQNQVNNILGNMKDHIAESGYGYIKLANGIMVQFGNAAMTCESGYNNVTTVVTMPQSFKSTTFFVILTANRNATALSSDIRECNTAGNPDRTTNSFTMSATKSTDIIYTVGVSYVAFGYWK